jgi:hypothetical protein
VSTQQSHHIAERAYLIWERMGRPNGQALEHWLRAEAELAEWTVSPASAEPSLAPRRARRKKT